jgi:transposase
MTRADTPTPAVTGPRGSLPIREDDEVALRLAMLIEGECETTGPIRAARRYGISRQRYYQIRRAYLEHGSDGLRSRPHGPRSNYRRPEDVVQQVIRHRFRDPKANPEVIAQILRQDGRKISSRSVERIIQEHGLQKKTTNAPNRSL